jgi:hypothetical protein
MFFNMNFKIKSPFILIDVVFLVFGMYNILIFSCVLGIVSASVLLSNIKYRYAGFPNILSSFFSWKYA